MLRLYYGFVGALEPDGRLYELSEYRSNRLKKLRPPAARKQSVGAELLLRAAFADCAPNRPWPPEIRAGEFGKPVWDVDGLYFSLSHSGELAACAIADRPLGLDVQIHCADREEVADRFFAPDERDDLHASADRDREFGRIWSLKESYVKALGTGLSTPFASFSVFDLPDAAFWYDFRDGCHFAVCVPGAKSAEPDTVIRKQLP